MGKKRMSMSFKGGMGKNLVLTAVFLSIMVFSCAPAGAEPTGPVMANITYPENASVIGGVAGFNATSNFTALNATWQFHNGTGWETLCENLTEGEEFANTSCDTTALADGEYEFTVAVDLGGANESRSENYTFFIDNTAPSVNITSPTAGASSSTALVYFNFTATDTVAEDMNCTISINGSYSNTILVNNGSETSYSITSLGPGLQNWSINCSDALNFNDTGTLTYYLYPNLVAESIWWEHYTGGVAYNNTGVGEKINVTVVINLTGDFNLTQNFSVGLSLDGGSWGNNYSIINSTINTSSRKLVLNFIDNITVPSPGNHTLNASIYPNQSQSLTTDDMISTSTVFAGYIVEVTNVTMNGSTTAWYNNTILANAPPNTTLTLTIYVKYMNGTGVAGLNSSNFSVYSQRNGSENYWAWENTSLSGFTTVGSGYYKINYTTPSVVWADDNSHNLENLPGTYFIFVDVTNGNFTNPANVTSYEDYAVFNVSAPYLTITYSIPSEVGDLAGLTSKTAYFNLTVSNVYGTAPIYNLSFGSSRSSGIYAFIFTTNSGSPDCDSVNLTVIAGGSSNLSCRLKMTTNAVVDEQWTNVTVYGYDEAGAFGGNMYYYSLVRDDIEVIDSEAGEEETTGGATGGSSGGGDSTPVFGISIISYPSKVYALPGGSNSTNVTVKNTGNATFVAKLKVTSANAIESATITPVSQSLAAGANVTFTVDFKVASTATPGEHTGTFTAYLATDADTNDVKTFKVSVIATEELANQTRQDFQNESVEVDALLERFRLINPAAVNDSNYTEANSLVQKLNTTYNLLKEAVASEDWVTASGLLLTLQADMTNAEAAVENVELEQAAAFGESLSGMWFWVIIIIVGVVAAGFVVYLVYPQKAAKEGFVSPAHKEPGFLDKLKGVGSKPSDAKDVSAPKQANLKQAEKPAAERKPEIATQKGKLPEGYVRHNGDYQYQHVTKEESDFLSKFKEKFKKKKKPQQNISKFFSSSGSTEQAPPASQSVAPTAQSEQSS